MGKKRHRMLEPIPFEKGGGLIDHEDSVSCSSFDELQDQAAELYMKLRVLQDNPQACAEASLAIHRWIGQDAQRQAAYDQVRQVLYHKGDPDVHDLAPVIRGFRPAANTDRPNLGNAAGLGWPDVLLLIFVFLLLLPMIYFLAIPVAGG